MNKQQTESLQIFTKKIKIKREYWYIKRRKNK